MDIILLYKGSDHIDSKDKLVKKIQTKAYHLELPLLKGKDSMKPNEYKLLIHMRNGY